MLQLYKNIKSRRTELGLTQSELAKKLGYADKSMIAKIEKGDVDLTQSKIVAFADALRLSPSELMGWEEEHKTPTTFAAHLEGEGYTPEQIDRIEAFARFVKSDTK